MSKNNLLELLKANRLMETPQEIMAFEDTLTELANNPNEDDLAKLHLILDDRCREPEIMFGLIHFLESFEIKKQLEAFISVVPQLMITAPDWTRIIHNRILNDEPACRIYHEILHSVNLQKPHFIYHLLEESAAIHLKITVSVRSL
ncbi:Imm30 family immunity protein [Limnofasciculus baicalensis]|uniref:Imm30 family immunity protein n=1 Tax=Limnofasciculus baicalensis BBK-W-15 TaxID=2699891 RepID=A0AAE3GQI8_9CYAN|nr:Imm30 family immunity protein [Limnofasciculus baicalensis]MCP2728334.1 Imm30 family immunity protein [Limnofasciculus baicalensis BBK-W-15]